MQRRLKGSPSCPGLFLALALMALADQRGGTYQEPVLLVRADLEVGS